MQWNLEWFGAQKSIKRDERRYTTVFNILSSLNADLFIFQEVAGPSGQAEAVFGHALVRDALYAATPWTRRRVHHRRLAAALEAAGSPAQAVAAQWLAAGDEARARPWLVAGARVACSAHAYVDAREAIRRALEGWSPDADPAGYLDALELWARCAERSGSLDDAVAALEELVTAYQHRIFGLALRMLGRGKRVGVVQFIKGAWHSAERDALEMLAADHRETLAEFAANLDSLAYRVHTFAFPILTFGIVAGAIWAQEAWGRYWGWDPIESWSLVTWLAYAILLHASAEQAKEWPEPDWIAVGTALEASGIEVVLPWGSARERARSEPATCSEGCAQCRAPRRLPARRHRGRVDP